MYQFINFFKLDDPENASLYQWPQECLRLENRRSQNSNSASGSTLLSFPYTMSFMMKELLDAASSVEEPDRPKAKGRSRKGEREWQISGKKTMVTLNEAF